MKILRKIAALALCFTMVAVFFGIKRDISFCSDAAVGYSLFRGKYTDDQLAALGNNLLAVEGVKINVYNTSKVVDEGLFDIKYLTDGSLTGGSYTSFHNPVWQRSSSRFTLDITFDLFGLYNIEKLFIDHYYDEIFMTGKYEFYLSSEHRSVFDEQNRYISYDQTATSSYSTPAKTQLFTFDEPVKNVGCIGLRITMPVSNFTQAKKQAAEMVFAKISEIGAFGTSYSRAEDTVNLLSDIPVSIYRSLDAVSEISENEYFGIKNSTDGNSATAYEIATNGKKIDFIYKLYAHSDITELSAALSDNAALKIYSSETENGLYEDSALCFEGSGNNIYNFECKLQTQFIRFNFETDSDILGVTELRAKGLGVFAPDTADLIENKTQKIALYLEDKQSYQLEEFSSELNKYTYKLPLTNLADGDFTTVCDLCAGEDYKNTVSLLIDLGAEYMLTDISYIAASSEGYWPSELKFYLGNEKETLFGNTAVSCYNIGAKDNEVYTYNAKTASARYIRLEVMATENPDYSGMIIPVIRELEISGYIEAPLDDTAALTSAYLSMTEYKTILRPAGITPTYTLAETYENTDKKADGLYGAQVNISTDNKLILAYSTATDFTPFNAADYSDVYLSYELVGDYDAANRLIITVNIGTATNGGSTSNAPDIWIIPKKKGVISLKERYGENWRDYFTGYDHIRFVAHTNSTTPLAIKINSAVGIRRAELPAEIVGFSGEHLFEYFKNTDLSTFTDTKDFEATVAIEGLKSSFRNSGEIETLLVPYRIGSTNLTLLNTENDNTLGSTKTTTAFKSGNQLVMTTGAGNWSYIKFYPENYDDVYFRLKIDNVRKAGTIAFNANEGEKDASAPINTDYVFDASSATNGYITLSFSELFGEDWRSRFTSGYYMRLVLTAKSELDADISIGSIVGVKYPDEYKTASKSASGNILATYWLSVLAENEALRAEYDAAKSAIDFGDCNWDGKTDVKDLVRIKRYAASIRSDIYKAAADLNCDGVPALSGDILALRNLILFGEY